MTTHNGLSKNNMVFSLNLTRKQKMAFTLIRRSLASPARLDWNRIVASIVIVHNSCACVTAIACGPYYICSSSSRILLPICSFLFRISIHTIIVYSSTVYSMHASSMCKYPPLLLIVFRCYYYNIHIKLCIFPFESVCEKNSL